MGALLFAVQKSRSIRVLASIISNMLEKPRCETMSQKPKSMCRSWPGERLSVFVVGPFGGWLNLDIRQMGHWCLYGGSGFLGRPRSVEERHIWSILR